MSNRQLFLLTLTLLIAASFAETSLAQAQQGDKKKAQELFEMLTNTTPRKIELEKVVNITSGKVLSAALGDRGRYLTTFDDHGNLALWDLDEGKQLSTRRPTGYPKTGVVAVEPHRLIAFGGPNGRVEIYNGDKREPPLNTYDQLKAPIVDIGFTDQGRFFALDETSTAIVGKARSPQFSLIPPEFKANDRPRAVMGVAGDKSWWRIAILDKEVRNRIFNGKRIIQQGPPFERIHKMHSQNGSAAGFAYFDIAIHNDCFCNEIDERTGKWKSDPKFQVLGKIIALARNLFTLEEWIATNYSIEICDLRVPELDHQIIALPDEMKRPMLQMAPMGNRLVSFNGGEAIVWKIVGKPIPRGYEVQREVNRLLDNKDVATLDLLADKLDGEIDVYNGALFDTPYVGLFRHFLSYPKEHTLTADQITMFEAMQKDHPDSKMLRLALFYLYSLPDPGAGVHSAAPKMRKGWEYVEPLLDQEKPPAEAFVAAFAAGPILNLPLDGYLARSFKLWPKYHRIYAEAALALSPVYGGEPEAAAALAAKVANAVGGDDGDVMYVEIARYVSAYNGDFLSTISELKFDRERMKRGFLILADRYNHFQILNEALLFAGMTRDQAMADHIAKRLGDNAHFPAKSLYPNVYPTIDKAVEQLIYRLNKG